MNKDEALKMAVAELWACSMLMNLDHSDYLYENVIKAQDACKEALEQPFTRDWKETIDERIARDSEFKEALEQPAWQGLTDDEIEELHHKWIMNSGNKDTQYDFARAIEKKLMDKNT